MRDSTADGGQSEVGVAVGGEGWREWSSIQYYAKKMCNGARREGGRSEMKE